MIKAKEDKRQKDAFSLYKMGKDKAVVTKFLERFKSKNGDPDKTATALVIWFMALDQQCVKKSKNSVVTVDK